VGGKKRRLLSDEAQKIFKGVLELAQSGHLSDPPDVELYVHIRTDNHGLDVWRCVRGTSDVEGAQSITPIFAASL